MASASLADGLVGLGPAPGRTPQWLAKLGRVGFASKGAVYVLVGVLAVRAALGPDSPTGSAGAMTVLRSQPFGIVLLLMAAFGLAAYVLWRLAAAIFNPERRSVTRRLGYVITVIIYAGLALEALRLGLGDPGSRGPDQATIHWTARLMSQPSGVFLVAAVAAGIAAYGLYQLYRAWTADVGHDLRLSALRRPPRHAVIASARAGLAARGIVFLVIAWFLGNAAFQTNPSEARDMAGALRALQQAPYGPVVLGVIALGLTSYGLHQFVRARYERIGA